MTEHLQARARLLADPPLWCWELIDPATGTVVASSWTDWWAAYPSSDAALQAANEYCGRPRTQSAPPPQRDAA